jgi:hypothetical protein
LSRQTETKRTERTRGAAGLQRSLDQSPTPERCLEAFHLQRTRFELVVERKLRRRQLTDDGNVEITGRDLRERDPRPIAGVDRAYASGLGRTMCGRAKLEGDISEIKIAFRVPPDYPTPNFAPSWNVAPTCPSCGTIPRPLTAPST